MEGSAWKLQNLGYWPFNNNITIVCIFWELFPNITWICPNLYHEKPGYIQTTTTTTSSTTSTCVYLCTPRSRHAQAQQGAAQAPRPHSCKIWMFRDITIKEKILYPNVLPFLTAIFPTKLAFINFFWHYFINIKSYMPYHQVMTDKMMFDDQGVAYNNNNDYDDYDDDDDAYVCTLFSRSYWV